MGNVYITTAKTTCQARNSGFIKITDLIFNNALLSTKKEVIIKTIFTMIPVTITKPV